MVGGREERGGGRERGRKGSWVKGGSDGRREGEKRGMVEEHLNCM